MVSESFYQGPVFYNIESFKTKRKKLSFYSCLKAKLQATKQKQKAKRKLGGNKKCNYLRNKVFQETSNLI